jgi:hypothetical protein
MKNIKQIVFGLALLTLLAVGSCKKSHCYHCYYYVCSFDASKMGDTLYVGNIFSSTEYHDSINKYNNLGYKINIDTLFCGYYPDGGPSYDVCDTNSVYNGQPVRDSCAIII